jgi:hypothetical protein
MVFGIGLMSLRSASALATTACGDALAAGRHRTLLGDDARSPAAPA